MKISVLLGALTGVLLSATSLLAANGTPFVSATTLGSLRNDYTGWVGMSVTVGDSPMSVSALGRMAVAGNSQNHVLKIVNAANGADVVSATLSFNGAVAGTYAYANLTSPVTLPANGTYYFLSQEQYAGDQWYDFNTVVSTTLAGTLTSAVHGTNAPYYTSSTANHQFGPVNFTYTLGTPFVSSTTPGTLRNDYTGWVGMAVTVGSSPVNVTSLGRMVAPGNSQSHVLKIVNASTNADLASATVNLSGATAGNYAYANLSSPVTLLPNGTYYVLSQEQWGYDKWYDYNTIVSTTAVGTLTSAAHGTGAPFITSGASSREYGPVNFTYTAGSSFVTSVNLGSIRNDYTGWVGMALTVANNPITVTSIGRMAVAGNSRAHAVKIVQANTNTDVASVTVNLQGAAPGTFAYGNLTSPVTLLAGASYYVLTQETAGGDQWYDYNTTVTTTDDATLTSAAHGGNGLYIKSNTANHQFAPLNFSYTSESSVAAQNIWIAMRTDGLPGTGTQADPFDGSTPAKFDAILQTYSTTLNLGIHFGAGTFRTATNHPWLVRPGWILSGAGMYNTTIQATGSVAGMRAFTVFASDSNITTDNVAIRDLTIDCNWAELSATADAGLGGEKHITVTAVALFGSNNLLDNMRCINTYGSAANRLEHFALFLSGARIGDSTNNVIQNCRAEQPQGTYGNPFALVGWTTTFPNYVLTNSKVIGCTAVGINNGTNTGFTSGGVNLANVKGIKVDSNSFTDCFGAAYIDEGTIDGLEVTNNTVVRGWEGVGIANPTSPKANITVTGNTLNIQNRNPLGASIGITNSFSTITNLTIDRNTITFDTSGKGMMQFWGIMAPLANTATITNNTIGVVTIGQGVGSNATGSGLTMFNNRTPAGALVPNLNNQ